MPTRNISLTTELDSFITTRVRTGRYENASEVVRAALRSLEREESDGGRNPASPSGHEERFRPVSIQGEPVSSTILRDRGSL